MDICKDVKAKEQNRVSIKYLLWQIETYIYKNNVAFLSRCL